MDDFEARMDKAAELRSQRLEQVTASAQKRKLREQQVSERQAADISAAESCHEAATRRLASADERREGELGRKIERASATLLRFEQNKNRNRGIYSDAEMRKT